MREENNFFDTTGGNPHPKKKFWKFWLVFSVFIIGFTAIIIRLFQIQIIQGDEYRERARRQHESKIAISAQRGDIYDRNGILLATTFKSLSIAADPTLLSNPQERESICKELARITGYSKNRFLKKIKKSKGEFTWLARGLMPEHENTFRKFNSPGLILAFEPKRKYLYGPVCSHVIGRTDIDNKGIEGIEKMWDTLLCGKSGYKLMRRDALGRLLPSAELQGSPAEHGKSIQLTISLNLQKIVEHELKSGVENLDAASGTAIAIKPETGEILAMASFPNYDPNIRSSKGLAEGAMRNRSITDTYEPGSTFKLMTLAAAVEEGLIGLGDSVNLGNGYRAYKGGYSIRDDHAVGKVTNREAFYESSNIWAAELGDSIPNDKFYKYVRDFGYGIPIGVDQPGEITGKLRKANKFTVNYKHYLGHGYGLSVTPLQIVNAYAAVANRGAMMKPYTVKKVLNHKGEPIETFEPEKIRRAITKKTADTLISLLVGVVEKGTGSRVKIEGLKIGGKTGTAQQFRGGTYASGAYTASFVGFFPAENPEIALLVLIDRPKEGYYGGSTAGPIFRNIVQSWINTTPDIILDLKKPQENKIYIRKKAVVPDITGLYYEEARKILRSYNLFIKDSANSEGLVVEQYPRPGVDTIEYIDVYVKLKRPDRAGLQASSKNEKAIPNVKNMALRRALNILHNSGYRVKVKGSGPVRHQRLIKRDSSGAVIELTCRM